MDPVLPEHLAQPWHPEVAKVLHEHVGHVLPPVIETLVVGYLTNMDFPVEFPAYDLVSRPIQNVHVLDFHTQKELTFQPIHVQLGNMSHVVQFQTETDTFRMRQYRHHHHERYWIEIRIPDERLRRTFSSGPATRSLRNVQIWIDGRPIIGEHIPPSVHAFAEHGIAHSELMSIADAVRNKSRSAPPDAVQNMFRRPEMDPVRIQPESIPTPLYGLHFRDTPHPVPSTPTQSSNSKRVPRSGSKSSKPKKSVSKYTEPVLTQRIELEKLRVERARLRLEQAVVQQQHPIKKTKPNPRRRTQVDKEFHKITKVDSSEKDDEDSSLVLEDSDNNRPTTDTKKSVPRGSGLQTKQTEKKSRPLSEAELALFFWSEEEEEEGTKRVTRSSVRKRKRTP